MAVRVPVTCSRGLLIAPSSSGTRYVILFPILKLPPVNVRLYLPFAATGVPLNEPLEPEVSKAPIVNVLVATAVIVRSCPLRTSVPLLVIPQVPVTRTTSPTANP